MERRTISPRLNWQQHVEELGFTFHTIDNEIYWDESAYYHFTAAEIDELEHATEVLQELCEKAVDWIIAEKRYEGFDLSPLAISLIEKSYSEQSPSLYGRFDLSYDGTSPPKMLEYNADTPTALFEASVVQWEWLQDLGLGEDQFNSIHEKLIAAWQVLVPPGQCVHFSGLLENEEEYGTLSYLADTALQVTRKIKLLHLQEISLESALFKKNFVGLHEDKINYLFKLYPWEWMLKDEFAPHLLKSNIKLFEPAWRMLLQNKNILAILWEMFPDCPYLLPAFASPDQISGDFVRKPKWGREGSDVTYHQPIRPIKSQDYTKDPNFIYQQWHTIRSFDGHHPTIGSWVIHGQSAGIGIREEKSIILTDNGRFIPHCFA